MLPSLFEEQINHDEQRIHALYEFQTYSSAESLSYFPEAEGLQRRTARISCSCSKRPRNRLSIPVIGSLNGSSPGGWARYAKLIQEAGADAIELNIYFVATDPEMTSADVERRYIDLVATVRDAVKIPIAVKIGPQFSNLTQFHPTVGTSRRERRCAVQSVLGARYRSGIAADHAAAGAEQSARAAGAVAMDRDSARPGVDLAGRDERHPLSGGRDQAAPGRGRRVHDHIDAAEAWHRLRRPRCSKQIQNWLDENDYDSVEQLKGSMSYGNCPDCGQFGTGKLHESDCFVHGRPLETKTWCDAAQL